MGRDEHKKKKNAVSSQTPKQQLKYSDGMDVEFSEEFADADDWEAQARDRAAIRRIKNK
ncbi:YfhD family protein [Oceanobacillus alkalisoli]|uniref:YfhD family protein n=1 Tax=Oceanobacillus alkalisoli TaxID=2925113 RepID=UPI001EF0E19F|nr:YfhD family protein [Oceanobacillus alkalisoli]MCF3944800.1 YfhD family protein [Oceanobacillus alkalisoli]MCG5105312.1 YfhD family protein [Oceanobacillus alkalisoli]